MVKFLDVKKYEKDVQEYLKMEYNAGSIPMKRNDIFTNSLGITYIVLEDAPKEDIYVRVACNFNYGSAIREIPKMILIS